MFQIVSAFSWENSLTCNRIPQTTRKTLTNDWSIRGFAFKTSSIRKLDSLCLGLRLLYHFGNAYWMAEYLVRLEGMKRQGKNVKNVIRKFHSISMWCFRFFAQLENYFLRFVCISLRNSPNTKCSMARGIAVDFIRLFGNNWQRAVDRKSVR